MALCRVPTEGAGMGSQGLAGRGRRRAAQVVGWEGPGSGPAPAAGARRRRGALVLVGAVLAGLVVGCSSPDPVIESPAPVVSEEPSPSPNPTPTPTPTGPVKPERPADMDRTDEVGAAAAAVYFLELAPYVMATGDLSEWDLMTWAETCGFCTGIKDQANEARAMGDSFTGAEVTLTEVEPGQLDDLIGGIPVLVTYQQEPLLRRSPTGDVVFEQPAGSGRVQVDTVSTDNGWKILAVSTVE